MDYIKLFILSMVPIIELRGAVPLPTTESWSGVALASIFKMRIKDALLGIFIGNAIAGAVMMTVSLHLSEGMTIETLLIGLVIVIAGIFTIAKKRKNNKLDTSLNDNNRLES